MLLVAMTTLAQGKQVVKVTENWSTADGITKDESNIVRRNIIQSLQATNRITIIDGENGNAAPNIVLTGEMNSLTDTKEYVTRTNSKTGAKENVLKHTIKLSFTISVVDPVSGATKLSRTYTSYGSSTNSYNEARAAAFSASSQHLKIFIEECFPLQGEILAVAEAKGAKATSVYTNLGTESGAEEGQRLKVYKVIMIAGEESEQEVGSLQIKTVLGATRSQCKVVSGGDVINSVLNAGGKLVIKTEPSKVGSFFDKLLN